MDTEKILVGMSKSGGREQLILSMANRHGLITGATGTGKTVTLKRIAEQFSLAGIPVFTADVKGDIAGLAEIGTENTKIKNLLKKYKLPAFSPQACPVIFWDFFGKKGHPLRTTISEIGPLLLGRILNANNVQQGIINAAFSVADDQGLLLLDLKDFRSLLDWISENAASLRSEYGNVSSSSVGALQRELLTLNNAGGNTFFGEPALKLEDLMRKDSSGKGYISILDATQLINDPLLYSTFLLWLLSELFERLPEVGDLDKPKLVFFFDEAHLLFNSISKSLLEKIEQMVRLIRSKGVGVYFVSQNPTDIPDSVLGQMGNRVQHALRAFTPKDQQAVRVAAKTFRQNPKLNTEKIITELSVGHALVSFLDDKGSPIPVEESAIIPPSCRLGSITDSERTEIIKKSPLGNAYDAAVDRESAYELIKKKMAAKEQAAAEEKSAQSEETRAAKIPRPRGRPRQSATETFIKSTARSVGSQLGRQIIRGVLGSIFGGRK